ncbi:MAG: hypothetical protein Q9217_000934 [Psora testacea]
MDFLKSAVASAISKDPPFHYKFGDRVTLRQSIWTLHNGTKREDGSDCSIFSFDVPNDRSRLPLARNAVRKMRTLRHPGVIKVLDTVETETYIYIATERVTPLEWHTNRKSLSEETSKWGLCTISNTLAFINAEASSVHGNLRLGSVFTSQSGEWRLGGFDVLSSLKEDDPIIYRYGSLLPNANTYAPPEIAKSGWESIKRHPLYATDAWGLGILIYEVFNGCFIESDQIGLTNRLPPSMHQSYKRLLNPNPKARLGIPHFRDQGRRSGGFFETLLIKLSQDIESLGLKSEEEREEFLSELDEVADDFPEEFFSVKVLPELLKSVEFGGGGAKVFASVMKIGRKLSDEEWGTKLTPVIVRLFANPDRAIRVCLLENLPNMIDHLPQKIVNDKIFPQMVTGFTDVAPLVREQTVKAVLTIITKLADRTINGELLKHLAKTSNDEQPGIRTNTTICMGKIARNLGSNTRQKVLIAAFSRSLRDPFVHARNAALLALAATSDLFSEEDCATKILPALCPSLLDKEKLVRDQTNKSFDIYVQKIRKYATTLPDTTLPPPSVAAANGVTPRMGTPQNDSAGWTGWAISSFTNKLGTASGAMQTKAPSTLQSPPQDERSSSVPPSDNTSRILPTSASVSTLHRQAVTSTSTPAWTPPELLFQDEQAQEELIDEAWGELAEDSFFDALSDAPVQPKPPTVTFDDGGEPDFEGWLKAQAQAKPESERPLPKGLSKSSNQGNGRTGVTRSATAGMVGFGAGSKQLATTATKPKLEAPKAIVTKPVEAGDDWGDAWD